MINIEIATVYLTAMLAVAPTKASHVYLNGVHLNAKDKKLEATDGYVALTINYPLTDELTENIILPVGFVADSVKVAKARGQNFVTIEYNPKDGSLKTALHNSVVLLNQFPKIERIFPKRYDQPSCFIDTKFINIFHNVMKPLVAVFKTACVWNPVYGLSHGGHNTCAVMQWKDISFIVMGFKIEENDAFSTADVLERLDN